MKKMIAFDLVRALWALQRFQSELLPETAADLLEAGHDTPAIRKLAAMIRPTAREAEPVFQEILRNLGHPAPNDSEAAVIVARYIASDLEEGIISPKECAERIAGLCPLVDYHQPFAEFLHLDDLWGCMPNERKGIEEDIRKEAHALLLSSGGI